MKIKSSDFIKAVKKINEEVPEADKHRTYLKLYSNIGKRFSWAIRESKNEWIDNYTDSKFEPRINLIERLNNVLLIEFDTLEDGLKPEDALEETEKNLKKLGFSYIRTTHKGKCDYIWVEFTKSISDEDAKKFLAWICPKNARIDLNFASSVKVFPVIFAPHRKHPHNEEIVYFNEGEKINFSKLKIQKNIKVEVSNEKLGDGFVYETAVKPEIIQEEISHKFKDKLLLKYIKEELSKTHIADDNLKMTTFLCDISGLLKNPKLRKSIAIKGNSSEGKDNLIKTCLKHMPTDSFIFLTSGTQAVIEDDIKDKRIIAFSEVNANRDAGANKYMVEVIKQKTEGGTSSMKKDIRTGMKEARHDVGEQACVNFGTTETDRDDELGTRFIEGNIKTDFGRIRKVNENTLDTFADINKLISDNEESDSWIRKGLTQFFKQQNQYEIYIPYANFLKEKINGQDIFDNSDPRSQRDLKRVLGLTCAVTYIHQLQREIKKYNDKLILVSEPQDLVNALQFSAEFFNQSYTGLDARLSEVLKIVEETKSEWVARDYIEEKIGCSKNTIVKYCKALSDEGCLRGIKGSELKEETGLKIYDSNKIYYKRYQKGIKKPLIRCQLSELKAFLEEKLKIEIDTFENDNISPILSSINDNKVDNERVSKERVSNQENMGINDTIDTLGGENDTIDTLGGENDTFKMIPKTFIKLNNDLSTTEEVKL